MSSRRLLLSLQNALRACPNSQIIERIVQNSSTTDIRDSASEYERHEIIFLQTILREFSINRVSGYNESPCSCSSRRNAPTSCLLLAYKALAHVGIHKQLVDLICESSNEPSCAWALRLAWVLSLLRKDIRKCQGVVREASGRRNIIPHINFSELPNWELYEQALKKRSIIRPQIMSVVFEILVDCISLCSQEEHIAAIGRWLKNTDTLRLIFDLLEHSDANSWKLALDNLSYIIENEPTNADVFILESSWQSWILSLLRSSHVAVLTSTNPEDFMDAVGDQASKYNFKMIINILTLILMRHMMTRREGTRHLLKNTIRNVEIQFGWNVETISIVRIVFFVLANRFKNSVSFAQNDMKTPAWANMLKLLDIVEEFVFHTGFESVSFSGISLHLFLDGTCQDQGLVDSIVQLLVKTTRLSTFDRHLDPSLPLSMAKYGDKFQNNLSFFSDIASLFGAHRSNNEGTILNLLRSIHFLKSKRKRPLKNKLFRKHHIEERNEHTTAERLRIANLRVLIEPESMHSASKTPSSIQEQCASLQNPTRITFLVANFPSPEEARAKAEKYSKDYRAVYQVKKSFVPTEDGHIQVQQNSTVAVLKQSSPNWALVSHDNQTGLVPISHLSEIPVAFEVDISVHGAMQIALSDARLNETNNITQEAPSSINSHPVVSSVKYSDDRDYKENSRSASVVEIPSNFSVDFGSTISAFTTFAADNMTEDFESFVLSRKGSSRKNPSLRSQKKFLSAPSQTATPRVSQTPTSTVSHGESKRENSLLVPRPRLRSRNMGSSKSSYLSGTPVPNQKLGISASDLSNLEVIISSVNASNVPTQVMNELEVFRKSKEHLELGSLQCNECNDMLPPKKVHNFENKILCAVHYTELCGHCISCKESLSDVVDSIRTSNGGRIHKKCAKCSVCHDNLDEYSTVPFRDGAIECLDHFVDMIVPKCVTCKEPIMGDHMKLLDRVFHWECLVCEGSCRKNLQNQTVFLSRKFRTFCEADFARIHQSSICFVCRLPIKRKKVARTGNNVMHRECVSCKICNRKMTENDKFYSAGEPPSLVCAADYEKKYAPVCHACGLLVKAADSRTRVGKTTYHLDCLRCHSCHKSLVNSTIYRRQENLYCEHDFNNQTKAAVKCEVCSQGINKASDGVKIQGKKLHKSCVRCKVCDVSLSQIGQVVYVTDKSIVCRVHYLEQKKIST